MADKTNVLVVVDSVADVSDAKFTNSKPLIQCKENSLIYKWNYQTNQYETAMQNSTGAPADVLDGGNY